jgi:hypothetical protein
MKCSTNVRHFHDAAFQVRIFICNKDAIFLEIRRMAGILLLLYELPGRFAGSTTTGDEYNAIRA